MYDIAVIGLGNAGLEVCNIALRNNLSIIAFEMNQLGGTCLNVGCIPTKAIIHSAEFYKKLKSSSDLGINIDNTAFNWQGVLKRKDKIVNTFNKALNQNLSKKIDIINDKAKLILKNNSVVIESQNKIYEAKKIIIATGSKPKELKGLKFDHKNIIDSNDLLKLESLPKSITIIGSGAIGLEWAMILSAFGVEVNIVEKMESLSPTSDTDIQKRIERILKINKIKFFTNDFVTEYYNSEVTLNSKNKFISEKILVAIGRSPQLPDIQFEQREHKFNLKINNDFSTNLDNVYVIGDAKNEIMLAHNAAKHAKDIMNKILYNKDIYKKNIPSVIYITPEIASVGLKEQDIKDDSSYKILKTMVSSIAKSWCDNANDGIIKVITKDNLIKGAHIVSKNASILISIFNILIEKEIPINEIQEFIFPHPCFSELIQEVIKDE